MTHRSWIRLQRFPSLQLLSKGNAVTVSLWVTASHLASKSTSYQAGLRFNLGTYCRGDTCIKLEQMAGVPGD